MSRTRPLAVASLALTAVLGGCFWPPEGPGGDPVATDDAVSIAEDSLRYIRVVDNDGAGAEVASVTPPTAGTAVVDSADDVLYTPAFDDCTEDGEDPVTFTYTLTNGTSATVSVTIDCEDDFHALHGVDADLPVTEGTTSVTVNPNLNIYEPDGPDFTQLQLVLTGGQAGDVLGVTIPGAGFVFLDDGGGQWRVVGTGTVAEYTAILRSVTLANPGGLEPGTRNVQFSVTNADGNAAFTDRDVVVTGV